MDVQKSDEITQGWLYLIRFNRFGLQYARRRYFVLQNQCLKSFKSVPLSDTQEPLRSAIVDSCIRVTDKGRESFKRKVFFVFTIYNTSNHKDHLKLGASSPEEAARWIHSLQNVAAETGTDSKRRWQPFRLNDSKSAKRTNSVDWTVSATRHVDAIMPDVIAPSQWKIFGCQNGLRLFKEAKDSNNSSESQRAGQPAIMAVGVVEGTSEAVFKILMSIGPSRYEWDFCFHGGTVVEHLDGHTDIIHMQLCRDWLPWGIKRRDLLLRRYWRREDDGTYVILYHSVIHSKCPPQDSYIRAYIHSGGFVVSPVNQGKESVVKHMLSVDWKLWKSYFPKTSTRSLTICMLGRVSALRELFRARAGELCSDDFLSRECVSIRINEQQQQVKPEGGQIMPMEEVKESPVSNASDEFFDFPDHSDDELEWDSESSQHCYVENCQPKLSSAAGFVKKLHDLAVQRKGYKDLQEVLRESNPSSYEYGSTFPKDSNCNLPCSWASTDPSTFLIRSDSYLEDQRKYKAKGTLMQLVAADWLKSDKREDDLAGRFGGIVQKYAAHGGPEFFFVINIQVPGTTTYSLALYYMMRTPLGSCSLLEHFVKGDDSFRNSRFKLIPYISKGSWLVKQSVGKKACLIGQALEINYFHGKNYIELGVDIGSSTVARGVVGLVLGYLNNLVIEMAFLIQANTHEELPETLLGTCRLNHMDASKSISVDSMNI
ncbi:protein ENHANCED DISEASE RESISTANCE 2-like isoform X1 [Helianthus annuus]|uniref:protein ENHANCED DISEASE RESISTANCE 2-like isoform X1 n=1 Tax=Helianthus annuus TaxID=4232 RepID=UPI000B8FD059|nr:protein ENHANCED DISEASE RESISTANCE 2-like isoform X1 [Helianthus annuus]